MHTSYGLTFCVIFLISTRAREADLLYAMLAAAPPSVVHRLFCI